MGCDIHVEYKTKVNGQYFDVSLNSFTEHGDLPFEWRHYGMFAFLAGVRNYSAITPISKPRGKTGIDSEFDIFDPYSNCVFSDMDKHSHSYLDISELDNYDYNKIIEDRRGDNGDTLEAGMGRFMTLRDFLGPSFFKSIELCKDNNINRIVFCFDN